MKCDGNHSAAVECSDPQCWQLATPDPPTRTLLSRVEALLKDITHYPKPWPNAFTVEGLLLKDALEQGEKSPWIGGTLAASKFIAEAPQLVRDLVAEVTRLHEENQQLRAVLNVYQPAQSTETGGTV